MQIDELGQEEYLRMRAVRLRALLDWPDAFGRTYAEEKAAPDQFWIDRIASQTSICFVARMGEQDCGITHGSVYTGREGAAGLFGMWVAPEARGKGAGESLVQRVIDWAEAAGYKRLLLDVADENPHAIALYERMGFQPTGIRGTLPPPREHITEHERAIHF